MTLNEPIIDAPEAHRSKATVEELLSMADRAAAWVESPYVDHDELLYDEDGLPK
jgi:antitoxin VapB